MEDAPAYRAFLSYSHHDKNWADWLHKALEAFRVPSALVGRETNAGRTPARLTPVFRDRDELPASDDLGGRITEALSRSSNLIVLCSPAAARSRWTNQEILTFKRVRPAGCIFAVIVAGEPFAIEMPGRAEEECFPPALRHKLAADGSLSEERAEPIAADLREGGDGKRMALLKLVAGMLGIGLDALARREAQRRQKRLALITGASLAGMVMTSGLAIVAVRSRDEAREQRVQAEGLVSFMLGDLRAKLEPLGRLDTLDAVGTRVLRYYQAQDKSELGEEGLRQRARALTLIGEIANLRGDLDGALRRYTEARASTAEALRRKPDDQQAIYDHAQNVYWVGYIAWQRGNTVEAETDFKEYQRLADRLVSLNPSKPEWQLERSYAETNLGTLQLEEHRYKDAALTFSSTVAGLEALVAQNPRNTTYRANLAESLADLADVQLATGRLTDATRNRARQLQILDGVIFADRDDASLKRQRMVAERMLGRQLVDSGDTNAGVAHLQTAVALAGELQEREPDNTEWLRQAAAIYAALGQVLLEVGRRDEAESAIRASCVTATHLVKRNPTVVAWRLGSLYMCLTLRAQSAAERGSRREALALAKQAIALSSTPKLRRTTADRNFSISEAALVAGDQYAALGNARAARTSWATALDSAVLPDPVMRLALLRRLGRQRAARTLSEQLESAGWRGRRYVRERYKVAENF